MNSQSFDLLNIYGEWPVAVKQDTLSISNNTLSVFRLLNCFTTGCYLVPTHFLSTISNYFYGRSFITNHVGDKIAEGSRDKEEVLVGKINLDEAENLRNVWGVFRDTAIPATKSGRGAGRGTAVPAAWRSSPRWNWPARR